MGSREQRAMSGRGRRLAMLALIVCGLLLELVLPNEAQANYTVRECFSGALGNLDAFQVRPFGGVTKIRQTDSCGSPYGLRLEANGQSNYSTWVAWQWTAPPNTIFDSV